MTCLASFVEFAEIRQWPLDFITRFHVHVLRTAFTFTFAYDIFGIFYEICRNQSMTPRFYYSDSCTCDRPPFERQRHRQRQTDTDRQSETDRQTHRERKRKSDRKTHRHQDTKRQQERQTNKSIAICLTLSRSFRSMLNQV